MKKIAIVMLLVALAAVPVFAMNLNFSAQGRIGYGFEWSEVDEEEAFYEKTKAQYLPVHLAGSVFFDEKSMLGVTAGVDLTLGTAGESYVDGTWVETDDFLKGMFSMMAAEASLEESFDAKDLICVDPFLAFTFRYAFSDQWVARALVGGRWKTMAGKFSSNNFDIRNIKKGFEVIVGLEGEYWFNENLGLNLGITGGYGIGNKSNIKFEKSPVSMDTMEADLKSCLSFEPSVGVVYQF